jgi:NAD(P)-dependent dehydrogenase (short-subunit alcohol dehydrogenase family)
MQDQRFRRIVNISSIIGKPPVSQQSLYAGSKLGLVGNSHSMAQLVGVYDINVNAVCPGSV